MLQYYGQFDPPVDRFIFERYFPDARLRGVAVECGACDGLTESSCKFFEESMEWACINIEAAPPLFAMLQKNRPRSFNFNFGLSNVDGVQRFKHARSPRVAAFGNGSFEHSAEHLASLRDEGCEFEEFDVRTITWRSFVELTSLERVDLMVLDVEGHEAAVLEGMTGCAVLPDVLCIEVGHSNFPVLREMLLILGYTYDTSSHVNAYFVKTALMPLFAQRALQRQLVATPG